MYIFLVSDAKTLDYYKHQNQENIYICIHKHIFPVNYTADCMCQ